MNLAVNEKSAESRITKIIKKNWHELLIAIYITSGITLFFILHVRNSEYLKMLDISTYDFSIEEAIIKSAYWGAMLFILIYSLSWALNNETQNAYLRTAGPYIEVVFLALIGLAAFCTTTGASNALNIGYLFALDGLLGITLYLYINQHKNIIARNKEEVAILSEALQMEHRELLQNINIIIWGMVVIFTSAVVASLIPGVSRFQGTSIQYDTWGMML